MVQVREGALEVRALRTRSRGCGFGRDFFGELFGGVNAKRTALTKLFAELFPDVMLHKEKTK